MCLVAVESQFDFAERIEKESLKSKNRFFVIQESSQPDCR
jgi:hypothetical protein